MASGSAKRRASSAGHRHEAGAGAGAADGEGGIAEREDAGGDDNVEATEEGGEAEDEVSDAADKEVERRDEEAAPVLVLVPAMSAVEFWAPSALAVTEVARLCRDGRGRRRRTHDSDSSGRRGRWAHSAATAAGSGTQPARQLPAVGIHSFCRLAFDAFHTFAQLKPSD